MTIQTVLGAEELTRLDKALEKVSEFTKIFEHTHEVGSESLTHLLDDMKSRRGSRGSTQNNVVSWVIYCLLNCPLFFAILPNNRWIHECWCQRFGCSCSSHRCIRGNCQKFSDNFCSIKFQKYVYFSYKLGATFYNK